MDRHLEADSLNDYAEGLLDASARAAADAHLAACPECRRELSAVSAYFRELAGLESVRAPADFLAKVRTRLPRTSPWKRAFSLLPAFLRAVPMPIAAAMILGVTAITVFIRQGGLEEPRTAPAPLADGPEAGGNRAPGPEAGMPPSAAKRVPRSDAPAVAENEADASAPQAETTRPAPAANPRYKKAERRASESVPDAEPPSAGDGAGKPEPPLARDLDRAGEASMPAPAAAFRARPSSVAPPAVPPAPSAADAEGSAPTTAGKAPAKERETDRGEPEAQAQARAEGSPGGIVLALRRAADTATILTGLRNMGVEVAGLPASAGAGSRERRYRLSAPPSMAEGILPYLERYGAVRDGRGGHPGKGSSILELRILIP